MTGDENDFVRRLRLTLPTRWFGDIAPVLDALLAGFSTAWSNLFDLLQFVRKQSRVRTVSGDFLDMASTDYVGDTVPRRPLESDDDFRDRVLQAMLRIRGTKPAIAAAASAAGYTVTVFEAAQAANTGAYNIAAGLAWNSMGAWGSLDMPLESLVVARPQATAVETELWRNVAGATPAGGTTWMRVQE